MFRQLTPISMAAFLALTGCGGGGGGSSSGGSSGGGGNGGGGNGGSPIPSACMAVESPGNFVDQAPQDCTGQAVCGRYLQVRMDTLCGSANLHRTILDSGTGIASMSDELDDNQSSSSGRSFNFALNGAQQADFNNEGQAIFTANGELLSLVDASDDRPVTSFMIKQGSNRDTSALDVQFSCAAYGVPSTSANGTGSFGSQANVGLSLNDEGDIILDLQIGGLGPVALTATSSSFEPDGTITASVGFAGFINLVSITGAISENDEAGIFQLNFLDLGQLQALVPQFNIPVDFTSSPLVCVADSATNQLAGFSGNYLASQVSADIADNNPQALQASVGLFTTQIADETITLNPTLGGSETPLSANLVAVPLQTNTFEYQAAGETKEITGLVGAGADVAIMIEGFDADATPESVQQRSSLTLFIRQQPQP